MYDTWGLNIVWIRKMGVSLRAGDFVLAGSSLGGGRCAKWSILVKKQVVQKGIKLPWLTDKINK